jgi:glycosyltransferase involved in cell wall biosynthesis
VRVLLVCHRYPPDGLGGVERYTETLAPALVGAGDQVSVVARRLAAPPEEPTLTREPQPDGITVYRLVGGQATLDPTSATLSAHQDRLDQLFTLVLAETAPDVVHVNHLLGLSPRLPILARRQGAAVVLTLHDFYFACPLVHLQKRSGERCAGPDGGAECARTCFSHEGADALLRWGLRTTYFRRLLAVAQRVVCPSRYVADYFAEHGADTARLRVVPNGIAIPAADPAAAFAPPPSSATFKVAFLGTVVPHKGVHTILDELDAARLDAVEFRVLGELGDPDYARALRARAAAIPGLRLHLYGGYDLAAVPSLIDDADCVVLASQVPESYSITTREALARGVPVVVARLGALPEAVREGENGYTFDPARPGALAAILQRLAADPALRHRLRRGALDTPRVTVADHAIIIQGIYDEAIEASVRQPGLSPGDAAELRFLDAALHRLA